MCSGYQYELWNGKEVIGYYYSRYLIFGIYLVVPTISEFKRHYNRNYEEIKVPISYRVVHDDGITRTIRAVLDVRKKSARQIAILKGT